MPEGPRKERHEALSQHPNCLSYGCQFLHACDCSTQSLRSRRQISISRDSASVLSWLTAARLFCFASTRMAPTSPVLPSTDQENTSLLYAVLPPLIKNSMPKVPSLRRSLSGYNRAAALVGHVRALSSESLRPGSATPPPPYQEPIASLTSVLSDIDFQDTPPTSPRSLPVDTPIFVNDERAGIQWEFARQGR
jgi:hypothetical protein